MKKLVALVYADYEALDSLGLNNPNNLKTIMDENLKNLNSNVAAYEKISRIQLYPTEFEKTPKRSIKRYLYNSIAVDQHVLKHIKRGEKWPVTKKIIKKVGISRTTY